MKAQAVRGTIRGRYAPVFLGMVSITGCGHTGRIPTMPLLRTAQARVVAHNF